MAVLHCRQFFGTIISPFSEGEIFCSPVSGMRGGFSNMAIKITRPQGTEDVTPKQIYKWHTVERIARETAESFGLTDVVTV